MDEGGTINYLSRSWAEWRGVAAESGLLKGADLERYTQEEGGSRRLAPLRDKSVPTTKHH